MSSKPEASADPPREDARGQSIVGPAVFLITLLASLIFFWWFLIYDHGLPMAH